MLRVKFGAYDNIMLKPHAYLNHNLIKVIDDIVITARDLINLQD